MPKGQMSLKKTFETTKAIPNYGAILLDKFDSFKVNKN